MSVINLKKYIEYKKKCSTLLPHLTKIPAVCFLAQQTRLSASGRGKAFHCLIYLDPVSLRRRAPSPFPIPFAMFFAITILNNSNSNKETSEYMIRNKIWRPIKNIELIKFDGRYIIYYVSV